MLQTGLLYTALILSLLVDLSFTAYYTFNYGDHGPDTWPINYPNICSGKSQSPINIYDWNAVYNPKLTPITFLNTDLLTTWNVSHDEYRVVFTPTLNSNPITVSGSDLNEKFNLMKFQFHWGENAYQGSEHTINEHKYPLEMQLTFKTQGHTIHMFSFLFSLSNLNRNNTALEPILQAVKVVNNESISLITQFKLASIIPTSDILLNYYRYSGSFTVPPCTEDITWTVFETPISISIFQLSPFYENSVKKNFRPTQRVNKRIVYASRKERTQSFDPMNDPTGGASTGTCPKSHSFSTILQPKHSLIACLIMFSAFILA